MKNLTLLLLVFGISFNLYADQLACGEANLKGVIKELEKGKLYIVVNEGTKSQIVFSTDKKLEPSLIPYENKPVTLNATIAKLKGLTKGYISAMQNIEHRVPNPLMGAKDTSLTMIKKNECHK